MFGKNSFFEFILLAGNILLTRFALFLAPEKEQWGKSE